MMTIVAANEDIAKKIRAIKILNEFISKGFVERKAFVQVVMEECPELNNYNGTTKLNNFWALRDFSINDKLEQVLENLKQS
ncbi:hypothetical protein [Myroides odoratus]|uniref:hypothetical protein n=1 Tax=Myroides odoratus TaxID=256 RepID=UPI000ACF48AC|nr:hypothetical protein [Myroides odoratus]